MIKPDVSRRSFTRASLSLLGAAAASAVDGAGFVQQRPTARGSTRRDVIKQELPGQPPRELTLVEVTYPPGGGSPPHLHANGVMAFVISGTVASKVGDAPEGTFRAGESWWELQAQSIGSLEMRAVPSRRRCSPSTLLPKAQRRPI